LRRIEVHLEANGDYWKAYWTGPGGRRQGKSLGPIKGKRSRTRRQPLSERQAQTLCRRLEAELNDRHTNGLADEVPRLGDFLDRYLEVRTDLGASSRKLHVQACDMLREFIDPATLVDQVTEAQALDWQAAVGRGDFNGGQTVGEQTICKHGRTARRVFQEAVKRRYLLRNPFDVVRRTPPAVDKDWHDCTHDQLDALLRHCPNAGWRAFLALCRLAGLRQGESLELTWNRVDLEERRLTVFAKKTGRRREVPIDSELVLILRTVQQEATSDRSRVTEGVNGNSHSNLRTRFHRICRKAGLEPWEHWCHTLRKNRETEWTERFGVATAAEWCGNSIAVAMRHYTRATKAEFAAASDLNGTPQETPQRDHGRSADHRKSLRNKVSRPGLEPGTSGLKGRCSTD